MIRKGRDKHGIYQDRTTQAHLRPCREHPDFWFLVGLGYLRSEFWKF